MGISARKKPAANLTTVEMIEECRAALAALEDKLAEAERTRDAKLLAQDVPAVERAESDRELIGKDIQREQRRLQLLEERAGQELRDRAEAAQHALLTRAEEKFAERDAAAIEMLDHMRAMIAAFRRAVTANALASTTFPFAYEDAAPSLLGSAFLKAIQGELYRMTGSPYVGAEVERPFEFPGAHCFSVTDKRPELIPPMADQIKEASSYALKVMRTRPERVMAATAPLRNYPTINPPALDDAPRHASAVEQTGEAPKPEYAWLVTLVNPEDGSQMQERIVFGQTDIDDASAIDHMGPSGIGGKGVAIRLATERAPPGFVYAATDRSALFDLATLTRSLS